jgi:hypothetical protein
MSGRRDKKIFRTKGEVGVPDVFRAKILLKLIMLVTLSLEISPKKL